LWKKRIYIHSVPHAQKAGLMDITNCVLFNTTFALKRIISG